jgi:hypothetical protein
VDAPAAVEAINWLLLTTLTIETFDQACTCIAWYTCRWVIETYHKVLKSGCRVENASLEMPKISSAISP